MYETSGHMNVLKDALNTIGVKKRTYTAMAGLFLAAIVAVTAPLEATAQGQLPAIEFCKTKNDIERLIWDQFPLKPFEECKVRFQLKEWGYNTYELSAGHSVGFDDDRKNYTHEKSGNRWEAVTPGNPLLIFEEEIDDGKGKRFFSTSMASYRRLNLKLNNVPQQLITYDEYILLRRLHNNAALYFTLGVKGVSLSKDKLMKGESTMASKRLMAVLDEDYLPGKGSIYNVTCIQGCKGPITGWVHGEDLVELTPMRLPKKPFPKVVMQPTNTVVKQCHVESTWSLSKQSIVELQASLGYKEVAEVGAALRQILTKGASRKYEKDIEVSWTVFTITEFRTSRNILGIEKKWVPDGKPLVVVVAKFTKGCDKQENVSRIKIITAENGTNPVGGFETSIAIQNTRQVNKFVFEALKSIGSTMDPWVLRHIAAGLSETLR